MIIQNLWNFVTAIAVRAFLIIHSLLAVWRAADVKNENLYWLLALTNVFIVAEGIIRIVKFDGKESKWFSPCILFYGAGLVPSIWILEVHRLQKYADISSLANITKAQNEALSTINGVTLPVKLDGDTWISVLEQSMLFIFIMARWILPRGRMTRDQLSQLLFVYIGAASDVMELFVIFEEPEVRADTTLSYVTLAVWTLSLFQFCLILTATRDIGGTIVAKDTDFQGEIPEDTPKGVERERMSSCCDKVFEVEIWSLFIGMLLQDGPFLGVRLYVIFVKGVMSYGILFFTAKNVLVLALLLYRLIIICHMVNSVDPDEDKTTCVKESRESVATTMSKQDLAKTMSKQDLEPLDRKTSQQSLISAFSSSSTKSGTINERCSVSNEESVDKS